MSEKTVVNRMELDGHDMQHAWERQEMYTKFWLEHVKTKGHLGCHNTEMYFIYTQQTLATSLLQILLQDLSRTRNKKRG